LVRIWVAARKSFAYDRARFLKWSGIKGVFGSRNTSRAAITMHYHALEKGLSLQSPRVGFGRKNRANLLRLLGRYLADYGADETTEAALSALDAYCDYNEKHAHSMLDVREKIKELREQEGAACYGSGVFGGTKKMTRKEYQEAGVMDLRSFFQSRYSVRQFSLDPVDFRLIEEVVTMAQKTPSVCNRQCWRIHAFTELEKIQKILDFQGGARGFTGVSVLLVVTAELGSFLSLSERYQCWIDGGLVSMSLLYALHSVGLGACPLNCSFTEKRDRAFRRLVPTLESESFIMMIAVGNLLEDFHVAHSHRKKISEVLLHHS